ncbi:MAG TPA: outer membrane beta-barrel protein [Allosphingosinicella sp.]|jgi:outer membrane immunogenic protein|nr:outer membrane beta-barrel protein [Allosphingosinicella sp.]
MKIGFFVAITAAGLVAAPAAAQDPTWTGFYIGVNGFGARDRLRASDTLLITQISNLQVNGRGLVVVPGTTLPLNASGHKTNADWGGQLGFQWQSGQFVFGAEADGDPFRHNVSVSQSQQLPPTALTPSTMIASTREVQIDRQWSVRARAGFAFSNTLVYATGGYAGARLSAFGIDTFTNPGGPAANCAPAPCQANLGPEGPNTTTSSNARGTVGGWRAGLGIDQRLGRHFSIGLEYLHTNFGAKTLPFASTVTSFAGTFTHGDNGATGTHGQVVTAGTRVAMTTDAIGLRVNFRF